MNLNLKGKTAFITGGSHGIGLAIKQELEAEDCHCTSISRREGTDVFEWHPEHLEADILINNVGGGGRWGNESWESTAFTTWQEVYRKNAEIAVECTMAVLPFMLKRQWGRVITIASVYGKEGGGRPWFTMAKAAEIALMKTLSLNSAYKEANITFNSVAPGPIWIADKEQDKYERYGQPEDVAGIVAFLCSDKAKWINGACITVDGGFSRSF